MKVFGLYRSKSTDKVSSDKKTRLQTYSPDFSHHHVRTISRAGELFNDAGWLEFTQFILYSKQSNKTDGAACGASWFGGRIACRCVCSPRFRGQGDDAVGTNLLSVIFVVAVALHDPKLLPYCPDVVDDLGLHQIEAHANHRDPKEEIKGAKGDPGLAVLLLLVGDEVSEPDGRQRYEAEVRAVQPGPALPFLKRKRNKPGCSLFIEILK